MIIGYLTSSTELHEVPIVLPDDTAKKWVNLLVDSQLTGIPMDDPQVQYEIAECFKKAYLKWSSPSEDQTAEELKT